MRVGVSLTSSHADAKDPRQGARWMIERTAAARRAGLDSLFLGDHHVSPTPYYQNTPMLGRLLAEWGAAPAGCLFLLPLWPPVLVAKQIGTLASIAAARRTRRSLARRQRAPGSRPGGADGGRLEREPRSHPPGGALPSRFLP